MSFKVLISCLCLVFIPVVLIGQQILTDIEGSTRIRGQLDLSNALDTSSLSIGNNAGYVGSKIHRNNTFIGHESGGDASYGHNNSFFGAYSGRANVEGFSNSFFGLGAGSGNVSGYSNSYFGENAGTGLKMGTYNSFFGNNAGGESENGSENALFGNYSGFQNSGDLNSFFGTHSGYENEGDVNSFIGAYSGHRNTSGNNNAFLGFYSGSHNSTGKQNVFVGSAAGANNETGNNNTSIGFGAGENHRFGHGNVFLGALSKGDTQSTENQVVIGYNSRGHGDNTVTIGNGDITDFFISQDSGALLHAANIKLNNLAQSQSSTNFVVQLDNQALGIRSLQSVRKNQWFLGQDTLGGIVFYIFEDQFGEQHGLIVSKEESSQAWQSANTVVGADKSWDGVHNTTVMNNSPAKTYVASLGSDWYLPSIDELSLLWQNRFHANKSLATVGGSLLSSNDYYWSSTEISSDSARNFRFDFGYANSNPKSTSLKTRAIKKF